MARHDHSSAVEAEEMIRKWLDKVEKESIMDAAAASIAQSHPHIGIPATPSHTSLSSHASTGLGTEDSRDLLSMVDWESGSIAQTTKSILDILMTKKIPRLPLLNHPKSHDPRVAMEMRHKQVKNRRDHRDTRQRRQLESRLLLEQAQREAKEVVLGEEREARKKTAMEEKLINQQISLVRGQIREQRKATNQLAVTQRKVIEAELKKKKKKKKEKRESGESEQTGLVGMLLASPTVIMAEKIVEDERKRQQTRSELVRQLEEAETRDLKERMRLLRGYFSVWYEEVVAQRAKVRRAVAVREWKEMARAWGAWRRWAVRRKNRREEAAATREMQRNMRLYHVASEHYECSLLLRVLRVWHRVVRVSQSQRREREEEVDRKRKMQSLLRMAKEVSETRSTPLPSPSTSGPHWNSAAASRPLSSSSHSLESPPTAAARPARKPPLPKFSTLRSEPSIYKMAQQEVVELLVEVQEEEAAKKRLQQRPCSPAMEDGSSRPRIVREAWWLETGGMGTAAVSGPRSPGASAGRRARQGKQTIRPKPKPVTKSVPMTGMESRVAAAAERRLARERRIEAQLREKAESLAREEEERQRAEQLARETALQQRREERRLARLKEQEKQRKQRILEEFNKKASDHYRSVLLRHSGLAPWKKFVIVCRENRQAADKLSQQQVQQRTFARWRTLWKNVMEEKEKMADDLHCAAVMKRTWKAWRMSRVISQEYALFASKMHPYLLVKTCYMGWKRVVKEEQNDYWEKCARARRFRQRYLQCQVLQVWHGYIPVAREERAREQRRAQLRLKVSTWLPDFVGRSHDDDQTDS